MDSENNITNNSNNNENNEQSIPLSSSSISNDSSRSTSSTSRLTPNASHSSSAPSRLTPHAPRYQDDEIDLIEYIKIIWKYKWFIILVTVFAVIGTYFYTKSLPKIYSSTVSVIIPQEEGGGSGLSAMLGGMGFGNMFAGNSSAELIVEVLKSRRMAEQVSRHFKLPRYYDGVITEQKLASFSQENALLIFANMQKKGYIDQLGKPLYRVNSSQEGLVFNIDPQFSKYQEKLNRLYKKEHRIKKDIQAVNILMNNTKIESTKSGLIKVTVEDITPVMSARMANYYITAMDAMNDELQINTKKPMLRVLDSAIVPDNKVRPKMSLNIIIVAFVAIFLSILMAYTFETIILEARK